jgi:hypothetical protein
VISVCDAIIRDDPRIPGAERRLRQAKALELGDRVDGAQRPELTPDFYPASGSRRLIICPVGASNTAPAAVTASRSSWRRSVVVGSGEAVAPGWAPRGRGVRCGLRRVRASPLANQPGVICRAGYAGQKNHPG